jgi:hypothetical protein
MSCALYPTSKGHMPKRLEQEASAVILQANNGGPNYPYERLNSTTGY